MDRVSGWYKRRSQIMIFIMGAVLAVGLNVDCIDIANRLSDDAALRQGLVAAAQEAVKQGPATNAGSKEVITANIKELKGPGLNVGWHLAACKDCPETIAANISDHCVGWLLTALACSLGAPFWFDLLNKFMVVRSTIKPSEKSQNETSKDPHG